VIYYPSVPTLWTFPHPPPAKPYLPRFVYRAGIQHVPDIKRGHTHSRYNCAYRFFSRPALGSAVRLLWVGYLSRTAARHSSHFIHAWVSRSLSSLQRLPGGGRWIPFHSLSRASLPPAPLTSAIHGRLPRAATMTLPYFLTSLSGQAVSSISFRLSAYAYTLVGAPIALLNIHRGLFATTCRAFAHPCACTFAAAPLPHSDGHGWFLRAVLIFHHTLSRPRAHGYTLPGRAHVFISGEQGDVDALHTHTRTAGCTGWRTEPCGRGSGGHRRPVLQRQPPATLPHAATVQRAVARRHWPATPSCCMCLFCRMTRPGSHPTTHLTCRFVHGGTGGDLLGHGATSLLSVGWDAGATF